MTPWIDVNEATSTVLCRATGCTAVVRNANDLCQWHQVNGEPESITTPGAKYAAQGPIGGSNHQAKKLRHQRERERLEAQIRACNRAIAAAREKRDAAQAALDRIAA